MRALYRRAEAYYSKGSTADLELCVTDLQSALKLEPGNTQVRAGGQGGGGGVDLQSALKLEPGNTRVGAGMWGRVDQSNYDVPVMFLEGTCSPLDAHLLVMLLYYSITLLLYYSITQLLYYYYSDDPAGAGSTGQTSGGAQGAGQVGRGGRGVEGRGGQRGDG